jgi:hypothetical protein
MMFREIIAVYSDNNTKPINTLCGQNSRVTKRESRRYTQHSAVESEDNNEFSISVVDLFKDTSFLIHKPIASTLKMEAVCSSEKLVALCT